MAYSNQLDIANTAARILGEEGVGGALSSTSQRVINRAIEDRISSAKRRVLAMHPWNFAMKLKTLRTLADVATVTGATAADPVVITYSGTDYFSDGDLVEIYDVVGMTELNNNTYLVNNVNTGANTLELQTVNAVDVDGTGYTAYSSAGSIRLKPAFGFGLKYDLPSDFVRAVDVSGEAEYEIVGTQLFTDETDPELRYVYDIDISTTAPDDSFNEALALFLAYDLAPLVTQDSNKRAQYWEEMRRVISSARFIDSSQHGPTQVRHDGALNARWGLWGRDDTKVSKMF